MWFNLLDACIIILFIAAAVRGAGTGLVRQVFSLGGFLVGLIAGAALAPYASRLTSDSVLRQLIIIGIVLVTAGIVGGIGEYMGQHLAGIVERLQGGLVDGGLGALFAMASTLIGVWLIAGIVVGTPYQGLNRLLSGSHIVRLLDARLPAAPPVITRLERLIDPNGFPRVFTGLEPTPNGDVTVATPGEVAAAVAADREATVKIQGTGCGGLVSGSGFVAADGLVMTNAHVVAGIARPVVIDSSGRHDTTTVVFDPNLDIAVLRVSGLAASPLILDEDEISSSVHAVVLGYPGGGDFTASAAGVIDERLATGRNIYDAGLTDREIYELEAVVQPGNSGGPLVLPDGRVIGVVFARSETNSDLGYALTMPEVVSRLDQARSATASVNTGACAAE